MKKLGDLYWVDSSSLPPNTPFCGFRGENPACVSLGINLSSGQKAAVVIVVLLFVSGLGCSGHIGLKKYGNSFTNEQISGYASNFRTFSSDSCSINSTRFGGEFWSKTSPSFHKLDNHQNPW
jgi:hypothetical protein